MKALVCGGRSFDDKGVVEQGLSYLHERRPLTVLLHGDSIGVDSLSKEWALSNGIWTLACPALQAKTRDDGVSRYQFMIDFFQPELLIAFPGDIGTKRMIEMAQLKSVPVWRAVLE